MPLFSRLLPPPEASLAELPAPFHLVELPRGISGQSLALSLSFHLFLLVTPLPDFLTSLVSAPKPETVAVEEPAKWLSNSRVLPPIYPKRKVRRRPSPGGEPNQPLPPLGAQVMQRQAVVSTPAQPNHPTQTLLQQFALDKARVETRNLKLPNMVLPPGPAPAQEEIDLRRLRVPNAPLDLSGPPQAPAPPVPRRRADLALAKARMENLLARLTLPTEKGERGRLDAPEVSAPLGSPRSGDLAAPGLLALSANPSAPPAVLRLPEGNLRARIVAGPYAGQGSPGGVPGGVPGAEGGSGGGPGGEAGGPRGGLEAPDIFVAPAGSVPAGPVIVGPGGDVGPGAPAAPQAPPRPQVSAPVQKQAQPPAPPPVGKKSPEERGRELMAAIHPGSQGSGAESGRRRVYLTYVFIANLGSQSSSWLLQYAEYTGDSAALPAGADVPLTAPEVVRKVDPCYSSETRWERVEGTVVLYAVIATDGSVRDVAVMRSVERQVDARAVEAFSHSRFAPARKNGAPVPVEVLVEIPFRLAPCL
ncbi:MAG: energy transducer TonB [Candidatus Acidiferrales bacterium]